MVFHWSQSDSKSPQVLRTLLSILTAFNNAVVWMVSNRPLFSKSYSPCSNPLVTVPSALITIGVTVTFTFHSFFSSLARINYLLLLLLSLLLLLLLLLLLSSLLLIYLFLLCLFGHLCFLLSSHITKHYQYINQILISNSTDSPKKYSIKFFFLFFLKSSNLILKFSTLLQFLIWLGNFIQKYITLLAKKKISVSELYVCIYVCMWIS